jgi:hypothetical protein
MPSPSFRNRQRHDVCGQYFAADALDVSPTTPSARFTVNAVHTPSADSTRFTSTVIHCQPFETSTNVRVSALTRFIHRVHPLHPVDLLQMSPNVRLVNPMHFINRVLQPFRPIFIGNSSLRVFLVDHTSLRHLYVRLRPGKN